MRKLTAILLLSILLFNILGYTFFYNFLESSRDIQLEDNLDKGKYSNDELISISLPLMNAYQQESNFERYDGEISYKGMMYKFVMRRVHDGNLQLLCLPNHQKLLLENSKFSLSGNLVNSTAGAKNQSFTKVQFALNEFEINNCNQLINRAIQVLDKIRDPKTADSLLVQFYEPPINPPDFA